MNQPVTFFEPRILAASVIASRVKSLVTIVVLIGLLVVGSNSTGLSLALAFTIVLVVIFDLTSLRPRLRRRIELNEDHLWVGGLDKGLTVPYSDVRLVRVIPSLQYDTLLIESAGGSTTLDLCKTEASECLHVLRQLCENAASIDAKDRADTPIESSKLLEGHAILHAVYRQRALNARRAVLFGGIIWTLTLAIAIMNPSAFPATPTLWAFVYGLPVLIAISAFVWLRCLKRAHRFDPNDTEKEGFKS